MAEQVAMKRIISPSDPHFSAVFQIFQGGFEAQERGRDYRLGIFVESGFYTLYGALDQDERVVGMAALMQPQGEDAAWLEYMAVQAHERNRGIGGEIMRWLLRPNDSYQALFFEVQIPHLAQNRDEAAIRHRRIRFYQRWGAKLLDHIPYRMWTPDGGIPMFLMAAPVQGRNVPAGSLLDDWVDGSLQRRREAYMKQNG